MVSRGSLVHRLASRGLPSAVFGITRKSRAPFGIRRLAKCSLGNHEAAL